MADPRMRGALAAVLLLVSSFSTVSADDGLDINGYYKNILTASETISTKKPYISHLQRFRFDVNEKLNDTFSARLVVDTEFLLNDFSGSPDFNLVRENNQRQLSFWDTHNVLVDKGDLYWQEYFYRAYLRYDSNLATCIIGKQNVDWSRMRFYHPFDLFNPISPLYIEKDEKMGVDAVNVEFRPADFMSYNFIYAPDEEPGDQSFGLRFASKLRDYDIFLMGADIKRTKYIGFAFDGYVKESGLRGEVTYTFDFHDAQSNTDFLRASIGVDHSFTPKLYGIAEYFYNGGAKLMDIPLFLTSIDFSRRALSVTKHIVGAGLEYELTGITKVANYLFYDIEGTSFFYNPEFRWNIKPNADIIIGCQVFAGDSASEYGNYHNLFYAEAKLFF